MKKLTAVETYFDETVAFQSSFSKKSAHPQPVDFIVIKTKYKNMKIMYLEKTFLKNNKSNRNT